MLGVFPPGSLTRPTNNEVPPSRGPRVTDPSWGRDTAPSGQGARQTQFPEAAVAEGHHGHKRTVVTYTHGAKSRSESEEHRKGGRGGGQAGSHHVGLASLLFSGPNLTEAPSAGRLWSKWHRKRPRRCSVIPLLAEDPVLMEPAIPRFTPSASPLAWKLRKDQDCVHFTGSGIPRTQPGPKQSPKQIFLGCVIGRTQPLVRGTMRG